MLLGILISWLGLYITRKNLDPEMLEKNHEVAAAVFDIAGLLYSLLVAFIIIAVWESYNKIDESIEKEAAKLGT
jgi:hypothetical protein